MNIIPQNGYALLKKYTKPVKPGFVLISSDLNPVSNVGTVINSITYANNLLVQFKQYSNIAVSDNDEMILVKEEDIICMFVEE